MRIKCVSGPDLAPASGEPRCQKVQKRVGFEAVVVVNVVAAAAAENGKGVTGYALF